MDEEGNTSILSFQPEGLLSNPGRPFATTQPSASGTVYAPKWFQPKCGARFGFGNKLVTFDKNNGGLLKVHHKKINPSLSERIARFDQ